MADEVDHLNRIIAEKAADIERANAKRRSDEDDFERRMAELKQHYNTLMTETKENLNQQFDIERDNIARIHESTLDKDKARAKLKYETLHLELEQARAEFAQRMEEDLKQIEQLKTIMETETSKAGLLNGQIDFSRQREKELENAKAELLQSLQKLQDKLNASQKEVEELTLGMSVCSTICSTNQFHLASSNEDQMRRLREGKIERDATTAEREKWEKELVRQLDILRNDLSQRLSQVSLKSHLLIDLITNRVISRLGTHRCHCHCKPTKEGRI